MNSYPNDKALPIVNGGASTTASGTQELVERLRKGAVDLCGEGCCYSKEMEEAAEEIIRLDRALHYEQNDVPGIERQLWKEAQAELDAAWEVLAAAQCPSTDHICNSIEYLVAERDAALKVDRTAPETSTRSADE